MVYFDTLGLTSSLAIAEKVEDILYAGCEKVPEKTQGSSEDTKAE